jgi:hypothetical protein
MILSLRAIQGVLCSIALLLTAVTASAQQTVSARATERRSVPATRLAPDERVALDGRLTESFWPRVAAASDFIQIDPSNGTPATERTEVRIAFDAEGPLHRRDLLRHRTRSLDCVSAPARRVSRLR